MIMPTSYTDPIKNDITFAEFAMGCSRAMGALIQMRELPIGAPIPDRFEIEPYYVESLDKARAELTRLESMPPSEIIERCAAEKSASIERDAVDKANSEALEKKYETMRTKVENWLPPTNDHVGLKNFMLKQIYDSVAFDCGVHRPREYESDSFKWHYEKLKHARESVERATTRLAEETTRVENRNAWLATLRASLA